METHTMAVSKMERLMAKEFINGITVKSMTGNGTRA
jgi:proline dehydrogenase